jgi:WD40 repeat protein
MSLHNVDHRADIYSLGATFYTLLAGEPPFANGTVAQKLLWHQMQEPEPINDRNRNVTPELAQIVHVMMAKNPDERFASMLELAEDLEPHCGDAVPQSGVLRAGLARSSRTGAQLSSSGSKSSSQLNPMSDSQSGRRTARLLQSQNETVTEEKRKHNAKSLQAEPRQNAESTSPEKEESKVREKTAKGHKNAALDPSLWWLGGLFLGFFVLIVGVVLFLVYGPSPSPQVTTTIRPNPEEVESTPTIMRSTTPQTIKPSHEIKAHESGETVVAYSPGGTMLVTGGADHLIRLWNLRTRESYLTIRGHTGAITRVDFNRSGSHILSSSTDGTVRVWDAATGTELRRLEHRTQLLLAFYERSEDQILTTTKNNRILRWSFETGEVLQEFEGHNAAVTAIVPRFGKHTHQQIVSGSLDKTLRLWRSDTGEQIRLFGDDLGEVSCLDVDGLGRNVLSGGKDYAVRLWDIESGKLLATFKELSGPVVAIYVNGDGDRGWAASADRRIIEWNLRDRKHIYTYEGHQSPITSLALQPNETQVAAGAADGTIRIWSLGPRF